MWTESRGIPWDHSCFLIGCQPGSLTEPVVPRKREAHPRRPARVGLRGRGVGTRRATLLCCTGRGQGDESDAPATGSNAKSDFWDSEEIDEHGGRERELEELDRSFGLRDGAAASEQLWNQPSAEDLEEELNALREEGLAPVKWDDHLSPSERAYIFEPDLPFDPWSRQVHQFPGDDPDMSEVEIIPNSELDQSLVRPLKWSDVQGGSQGSDLDAMAREVAEAESKEVIEYAAQVDPPSRADLEKWREASISRGGSVSVGGDDPPTIHSLPPLRGEPDDVDDERGRERAVDPIDQPGTLSAELGGTWQGTLVHVDTSGRTIREEPRSSSYRTTEPLSAALSLNPRAVSAELPSAADSLVVVTDRSLAEGGAVELDPETAAAIEALRARRRLPAGTVVFAGGSYTAGATGADDAPFFADFCFRHGECCYRVHAASSDGEQIDEIRVAVETRAEHAGACGQVAAPEVNWDTTPTVDYFTGEWSGTAVSFTRGLAHPAATEIDVVTMLDRGEVALDDAFDSSSSERLDPMVEPKTKPEKPASRPSKKVRQARQRDRERVARCNVRHELELGSLQSSVVGTEEHGGAVVEFPLLENRTGGRRSVFLPWGLWLDYPTSLRGTKRWLLSATFQPHSDSSQRWRMFRAFSASGEFVGAAMAAEQRRIDSTPDDDQPDPVNMY